MPSSVGFRPLLIKVGHPSWTAWKSARSEFSMSLVAKSINGLKIEPVFTQQKFTVGPLTTTKPQSEEMPKLPSNTTPTTEQMAATLLFTDPMTGEDLIPTGPPHGVNGALEIVVSTKDGKRKWKHTLRTEEV
jgi:hypothetical protein